MQVPKCPLFGGSTVQIINHLSAYLYVLFISVHPPPALSFITEKIGVVPWSQ